MKPLLDENLWPELAEDFNADYPGSADVESVGLDRSSDPLIWQFALQHDFVILTKDKDFAERAMASPNGPKVIWLRLGNCQSQVVLDVLRARGADISAFERQIDVRCLTLWHIHTV